MVKEKDLFDAKKDKEPKVANPTSCKDLIKKENKKQSSDKSILEIKDYVTPDILFGSGNTNGLFTCRRSENIEICLRAKQRYPAANPTEAINWNNEDGSFTVKAGDATACCSQFTSNCLPFRAYWSIDWSINVDYRRRGVNKIADFDYVLAMDADPSCDTCFVNFYQLTPTSVQPFYDHSFGDNTLTNGAGQEASTPEEFERFKDTYNVVQNSFNPAFLAFLGTGLEFFDPSVEGTYVIALRVGKFKNADRTPTCSCGNNNDFFESYVSLEVPIIVDSATEIYSTADAPPQCVFPF
ncbi:hypothetical protein ACA910_003572 [Epithemia clementina (nom. ined.)]